MNETRDTNSPPLPCPPSLQSGSTRMLERMRRGYTSEAYAALLERARARLGAQAALSTDVLVGFCGEDETDHAATLDLLAAARFEMAYLFAYSLRERTHAAYHYKDDVPAETKLQRLQEAIAIFRTGAAQRNAAEAGRLHLVLVEGAARRSTPAAPQLAARTGSGKRVILADVPLPVAAPAGAALRAQLRDGAPPPAAAAAAGDWVLCRVTAGGASSLHAQPLARVDGGLLELPALRAACAPEEEVWG